jgi:outer membrane protein assembly factor BamD
VTITALASLGGGLSAQSTGAPAAQQTTQTTPAPTATIDNSSVYKRGRKKADKTADSKEKTVQSKDTKKDEKKNQKVVAVAGADAKLPDKQLYDKALVAIDKGHFDVARLDLQTMLNTYPDSQYQMRAKLAVADSWYKEGGTAALTQAETEYRDFTVFFPNAPEAAEAQMRIGDIYFREMDKPDRDYTKSLHAEEEYRRMLTDYPDAPKELLTRAKTRLREVQEVLASREANIAIYYASRDNYAAEIARYQTVVDSYPLYSHMDDTLIGLGDAYEAEARFVRRLNIPEGPKAKLEAEYDGLAADCYRKVVLEHAAAPHVEDAKDRLAAMNLPIPEPSKEQLAASVALEDSRRQYQITDRLKLFILHQPDTVNTAGIGEPTLTDPKPTLAPTVVKRVQGDFNTAFAAAAPAAAPGSAAAPAAPTTATASASDAAGATPAPATAAAPATPAAPLAFKEVGTEDSGAPSGTTTMVPASSGAAVTSTGISAEIINAAKDPDAAAAATGQPTPNGGLKTVGTPAAALPAVEKPAPAPDEPNQVNAATPAAQAAPANGKKAPKPALDKKDESSSKKKKKKGLDKLNPF